MTSFSVVIPVYNAEANLDALYERIMNDVQETSEDVFKIPYGNLVDQSIKQEPLSSTQAQ